MATLEPLTLNTEPHVLLHYLLAGNTEGGWDLYIPKIVITRGIQGKLVQASYSSTYITSIVFSQWRGRNLYKSGRMTGRREKYKIILQVQA